MRFVSLCCAATVSYRYLLRVTKRKARTNQTIVFPVSETHIVSTTFSTNGHLYLMFCYFQPKLFKKKKKQSVEVRNNSQVACFPQKQVRVWWWAQKLDKMKVNQWMLSP